MFHNTYISYFRWLNVCTCIMYIYTTYVQRFIDGNVPSFTCYSDTYILHRYNLIQFTRTLIYNELRTVFYQKQTIMLRKKGYSCKLSSRVLCLTLFNKVSKHSGETFRIASCKFETYLIT